MRRAPEWGLTAYGGLVLRVELDDQLLREDRVDLRTGRELVDEDREAALDDLHPRRDRAVAERLAGQLERERLHRLLAHGDDVELLEAVRRHVDALAVDLEVAVGDELTGRPTRTGETRAVDDVVEPRLEDGQEVVTGLAGTVRRFLVVAD